MEGRNRCEKYDFAILVQTSSAVATVRSKPALSSKLTADSFIVMNTGAADPEQTALE